MVEVQILLKLDQHDHETFDLLEIQDNTTTATTKMFIQGNPTPFCKKGPVVRCWYKNKLKIYK